MLSIIRQRSCKHYLQCTLHLKKLLFSRLKQTEYYFGYGANLTTDRFLKRNMHVTEVGNANASGYQLDFTLANEYEGKGYAGIHKSRSDEVWGVLYKIDKHSLKLLDCLEWAGFGAYERRRVVVAGDSGELYRCWCYFVKTPKKDLLPSSQYLDNIIKAAKMRNFPISYINYLEKHKSGDSFEIDNSFSLLFYGKKRYFYKFLKPVYAVHDRLREKLCSII